jgi:UDP-N-acetylmuramoyl-L-alanyl-D-glutamate--2,6-diaminopimelate ligase
MERVDAGQDFLAIVDYAHQPAALEAVLGAVREVTKAGSSWWSGAVVTGTGASAR